jgi:hypothetical protein
MRIRSIVQFFFLMGAIAFTGLQASAQESCAQIEAVILACQPPGVIFGDPPFCQCDGLKVEKLELTCEANFGCPNETYVGFGDWPNCGCRAKDEPVVVGPETDITVEAPEPETFIGASEGGDAVCQQFFSCPGGTMMVQNGRCTCMAQMLPQFND